MPELSNLLRQRLGENQNAGGTHPDADQLTALAEQSLTAAEREQVLMHLSMCPECREVAALSLPQAPEVATQAGKVMQPASVSRWRKIFTPAFGLAGLVTAMALVAVVVLQSPRKTGEQTSAQQQAQAVPQAQAGPSEDKAAAAAPKSAPAPVAEDRAVANEAGLKRERVDQDALSAKAAAGAAAPAKRDTARRAGAVNQPALTAALAKQDFVNKEFFAVNATEVVDGAASTDGLPSAPPAKTAANGTRFSVSSTPGQITVFRDIPQNQTSTNRNLAVMTPPPPPERLGCPLCKIVNKGKAAVRSLRPSTVPALSSGVTTFSAMGDQKKFSTDLQSQHPTEAAAAPEKVGLDNLQVFDSLNGVAGGVTGGAASEYAAPAWRVAGGKLIKMTGSQGTEAFPGASFQFTFVSARGDEVWAGGTHASVIHSRNNGATWEAAKLGETASGSIVSILFSGNNIQVKTSDDQLWSSGDGGKNWTMQ